jgi:uncharacterized protein DUF3606
MVDDLMERRARDRSRISLQEDWELKYWAQTFGVTEERLKDAVRVVGSYAMDVRDYLERQRRGSARDSGRKAQHTG